MRIVLDDEEHACRPRGPRSRSSATGFLDLRRRPAPARRSARCNGEPRRGGSCRCVGPVYGERQVERERAARRRACSDERISPPSRSASSRLIARPRPGAAVLAAGARVGLLERLEDQPLLLRRDADAGVGDRERDRRLAGARTGWSAVQPDVTCRRVIATLPCAVNLNAFDRRFLRICCSRFGSVTSARGSAESISTLNAEALRLGDLVERPVHVSRRLTNVISSGSTVTVPDSIFERSRMSLISVSRSVPGGVDVLGELDLLVGEVAADVLGELLAEDQERVERRAQLVRHVREELRLVLRRERQLARPSPRAPAAPARPPCSCARPRRSARRAASP